MPDQASLLRGRRCKRTKGKQGGDHKSTGQNVRLVNTAKTLAKEHHVDERTIRRDGEHLTLVIAGIDSGCAITWSNLSKHRILFQRLLEGNSDNNIRFEELCSLLRRLGFTERIKGGHHIFSMDRISEIINLQKRSDGKAKAYQVGQVRYLVQEYRLGEEFNEN